MCCASGDVDDCGVCSGDNSTCVGTFAAGIRVDGNQLVQLDPESVVAAFTAAVQSNFDVNLSAGNVTYLAKQRGWTYDEVRSYQC